MARWAFVFQAKDARGLDWQEWRLGAALGGVGWGDAQALGRSSMHVGQRGAGGFALNKVFKSKENRLVCHHAESMVFLFF
ncbi:hypothetical protein [Allofranklinella schreckenbergeri]|uniref:hypothetical protein n=1 Tax=Allofranklinella schreckenbergeri TaxID=1076744 RepID=UPI0011C49BD1|nr:hypothetical protein [Allofranklinella schreckenbergeri]